MAAITAFGASI